MRRLDRTGPLDQQKLIFRWEAGQQYPPLLRGWGKGCVVAALPYNVFESAWLVAEFRLGSGIVLVKAHPDWMCTVFARCHSYDRPCILNRAFTHYSLTILNFLSHLNKTYTPFPMDLLFA